MPQVLTTNALILCPHGGKGTTTPSSLKWQVNGAFVALEGDQGVLSCVFLPPCVGYTLKSMGLNATQVDGRKVILVTDFNRSYTGMPLLMTELHQTYDESTPAPVPPGQAAPQLPPALADLLAPVVTPPIQTAPFSSAAPAPVTVNFSLTSAHPKQWFLTFLNTTQGTSIDLTSGSPPDVVVTPSGGGWSSPALSITVVMSPGFLTAQAVGTHHLYLTAVSQRGLSGYAEARVQVS